MSSHGHGVPAGALVRRAPCGRALSRALLAQFEVVQLYATIYTPNVDLQLDDTADESARIDLTEHRPAIDVPRAPALPRALPCETRSFGGAAGDGVNDADGGEAGAGGGPGLGSRALSGGTTPGS